MSPHYYWIPEDRIVIQFARPHTYQSLPFGMDGRRLILQSNLAYVNMSRDPSCFMLKCIKNRGGSNVDLSFIRMLQANMASLQVFDHAEDIPDAFADLRPTEYIQYGPHLVITDESDLVMFKLLFSEYYHDSE